MAQRLVDFIIQKNSLRISVIDRDALQEIADHDDWTDDSKFLEACEWHLCNGWETIVPEEIAALAEGLILSNDCERNDNHEITDLKVVYWDSNYQIRSAFQKLLDE